MSLRILQKAALPEWIEQIGQDHRIFGPKSVQEQYIFSEIRSAEEIDLDYPTSILPPKKVLLPQREDLIRFNNRENRIDALKESPSTVIFGIHTCDMHAISFIDEVFSKEITDQHYLTRRKNTTLVSIECLSPCNEYSFCKDMGTLNTPDHYDLHLTDLGDSYAIDIGSAKGESLLRGSLHISEATDKDHRRFNRVISSKWPQFPYRLQMDVTDLPSLLTMSYKSSIWEELAVHCLGCGMCTIVCPTCYCFGVSDEVDFSLSSGIRYRLWDSCQLNDFAVVAGGHDFRPGQAKRQRHRFLRKYKYQSISSGLVGCVGCGRCAQTCLVQINPVNVLNKLHQRRVASTHNQRKVVL